MRKKDLVARVAKRFELSQKKADDLVDYVFDQIVLAAVSGKDYHHPGFGCFTLATRKQRVIHNVNTRELVTIPKKKMLRLVPSRRLNKKLNEKAPAARKKGSKPKARHKK